MKNIFNKKIINKSIAAVLNSKYTYIIVLAAVIIQFALVSVMYIRLKAVKPFPEATLEQINMKIDKISSMQNLQNEKMNSLQSAITMLQAQLYRTQQ